jgi:S-adenosylmethionine-diacylgycerolhomoserine-N-methlytransferase
MSGSAAESMDRIYRYQRFIYDATRRYFLLGRDTLIDGLAPPEGATVVEVGCGTARNLIRIAERYPSVRLYGVDVSAMMLDMASRRVAAAGLAHRIRLGQADATTLELGSLFGIDRADRLVFSYVLSMIPAWGEALETAANRLQMQGSLHVVDFGDCEGWPVPVRSALNAWLARFSVAPRRDLTVALRNVAGRHNLGCFHTSLYRGYATYGVLTRR